MVMTNVCKETKTKYLNIDTKFCDEYNNNWLDPTKPNFNVSNYNVTIPDRINDVKRISLMNVEIPMTFYNISSSLGNNYFKITITVNEESETFMIFIPDGQYTIDLLKDTINSFFVNIPNIYNFTTILSNESYYPTFGFYLNKVYLYLSQSNSQMVMDFAVDKNGEFDKYNFKSKLGWLLGFRQPSYTLNGIQAPSSDTTITNDIDDVLFAENNYNLNVHRYFYLAIDEYSKGNQNSFISALSNSSINKNIIAKICVSFPLFPYNTVLNANKTNGLLMTDERSYTGKTDIQKLNIQLLDDVGRPVNLNGSDFSFGLKIECE